MLDKAKPMEWYANGSLRMMQEKLVSYLAHVRPLDEQGVLLAGMTAEVHTGTLVPGDRSVKMRQCLSI